MPQTEKDRHHQIGDPESSGRKAGVWLAQGFVRQPGYQRQQKKPAEYFFVEAVVEADEKSLPNGESGCGYKRQVGKDGNHGEQADQKHDADSNPGDYTFVETLPPLILKRVASQPTL